MLIGVVGKTNVGKSTFFKASTMADVEIHNRPFVTIKPNQGKGYVKVKCVEDEFDTDCEPNLGYCEEGDRFVPIDLLDVAGLVPGAHKGEGLGTQFLDDLRQADAFIHVIDASGSTNERGESVPTHTYDPANDIKFLEQEIDMWFYQILQKSWKKFARKTHQQKAKVEEAVVEQFSGLKINKNMVRDAIDKLDLGKPTINWTDEDLKKFASQLRKSSKKMIIAANKADVPGSYKAVKKLQEEFSDYIVVPCSAESELALREASKKGLIDYVPGEGDFEILEPGKLNEKQKKGLEFIKEHVLKEFGSTGVQDVLNKSVFELLEYIGVFPVATNRLTNSDGHILPDCLLVPSDTTPEEFAYMIHSDIGKNFVKAIDMRKNLPVGKDDKLKHRDVIEIRTSK